MSFAYCSIISGENGSKPLGLLPKKDSPDNFKRMRLYFGSMYTILFGLQIESIFAQVPSGQDKNLNKYSFNSIRLPGTSIQRKILGSNFWYGTKDAMGSTVYLPRCTL